MADYAIHDTTLTGIADTIRKKDGTAALIDPADYADRINLMGMLEEKTQASAPVCSFEDGADDVPSSSVKVTIPPTLSGVSSVSETQTGKNLLKITGSAVSGDLTVTPQTDGTVIVNGQRSTALTWNAGQFVAKGACSIVFSGCSGGSGSTYSINIQKNNVYQADVYSGDSIAYNLVQGDVVKFIVVVRANVSMSNVVFSPMIRFSVVTDGTFEKYTETQYTANLGRTIYGGQADIVNGNCEPTNWLDDTLANLEQGSINGSTGANENANNRVRNASAIPFPYDEIASSYTWTIPSGYKVAIRPYDANGNFVQLPSWALAFITQLPQDLIGQGITQMRFVLAKTDNSVITPSDMAEVGYILNKGNTAAAYSPYFSPFTFTGQEVNTRLGYNAFWSDEGDTEVTYRSSGTITPVPVVPTLITKTITENGTYSAEDDDADGYSSVTVNVEGVPSGNHDDPLGIMTDYTRCNISNLYSAYYIGNGALKKEVVFKMSSGSGYEGFCISLDDLDLTEGTDYTMTFVLNVPAEVTFSGSYPWGIKHSASRVPASGSANTNTFNITPTVNFAEQTGSQNVSITFTAGSSNYLLVLLSRMAGSVTSWITMRDIEIEEAAS